MVPRVRHRPTVTRFTLDNGLTVLLAPEPSSPTASVWVWYRVGSKNEWPGVTGASHWVEHMLFLGSPHYPKGAMDRAVMEVGGTLNAFTDSDFTAYFTTVPREHVEVPLDIEADRMTRARIIPKEVERERTIIRSEREGNENWPEFRVEEELYALAFQRHPYRWDALGYPEDIRSLTPAQLADYYRRFYGPRNAVLVVAGGFSLGTMRSRVRRKFSRLPATGADPTVTAQEPAPTAERRSTLHGPGTLPFVEVGWRAPAVTDRTTAATMLLDVILGGETRMFATGATWGRSPEHPSSRLYRRLVDTGLAVRATSEWRPRVHPGLFTVHVQAATGVSLERLEGVLFRETKRLATDGPRPDELRDARTKIARASELSYEGATRTGFRLGYFATLGPWGFEDRLLRRTLATTSAQVREAARGTFVDSARTVVRYEPRRDPA
jgi:zinc protease